METFAILIFIFFGVLLFVYKTNQHDVIKRDGYRTRGEVTGHEKKFRHVAGSMTLVNVPKVRYVNKEGKTTVDLLKNARGGDRAYPVGQQVAIIVYQGNVYVEAGL